MSGREISRPGDNNVLQKFRPDVLIVEDEALSRRLLTTTLKNNGARVISAESAEEALVVMQAIRITVILVDLGLPGMSGAEYIERVKAMPAYVDTPIIVVTADASELALQEAFEAGAHDVIVKPAAPRELLARVEAAIRLYQALQKHKEKQQELDVSLKYLRQDLAAAARLQRSLLPDRGMHLMGLDFTWFFESCDEVGGDLLNCFPLNDREVALYLADAAGHGVSAALNAMAINSALINGRFGLLTDSRGRARPPSDVMRQLNERFQMDLDEANYFTMTYCVVDCLERELRFVQAGQPPALIISADNVESWRQGGTPIGLLPDSTWEDTTVAFGKGVKVLLYSDGLPDLSGPRGEMFGMPRLFELASEWRDCSVTTFGEQLDQTIQTWGRGVPQQDDVSYLLFENAKDYLEFHVSVSATLAGVRELALKLRDALVPIPLEEISITRADLALTELATNAVKHGYPKGNSGTLSLSLRVKLERLWFTLSDDGVEFNPLIAEVVTLEDWELDDADDSSLSLGITIAKEIVEQPRYERRDGRNFLSAEIALGDDVPLDGSAL